MTDEGYAYCDLGEIFIQSKIIALAAASTTPHDSINIHELHLQR